MPIPKRKSAIVTGAGNGLGKAITLVLLEAGCNVVAVETDKTKLEALAGSHAGRIVPVLADVRDGNAPSRSVDAAMERFGRLDFLINNAGVRTTAPVQETDDKTLDLAIDVMLRAPFRFCREALAHMGEGSCIVNVASTYALVGGLNGGSYSVVKAGILGLTKNIACDSGARGIRCNAVAPGVIPTGMTENLMAVDERSRMNQEMTPAVGWGTAEDVAGVVAFLCSDKARWINGETIAIDGGWSSTKYLSEYARAVGRIS